MKNILRLKPFIISSDVEKNVRSIKEISNQIEKINFNRKFKLRFSIEDLTSEFTYHGLKIIVCDEINVLLRDLLNDNNSYSKILINNKFVRNKDIVHIHSFSKISDFLNTKNNGILHEFLKNKDIEKNNLKFEDFIIQQFKEIKNDDLNKLSEIDLTDATILNFVNISKDYINSENIINLLNIIKFGTNDKPLIIINDYQIIDIELILKTYINDFHFLIFTNNLSKWINDIRYIECLIIINDFIKDELKVDSLEILDKRTLVKYLSKKIKQEKEYNKKFLENFIV